MGNSLSTIFLLDQFKRDDRKVYYTRSEIAKHNTLDSLWVVSNNKVYDITYFFALDKHPGGNSILLSRGGGIKNCEKDFKFHSNKTKKLWNNYLIGYVAP